MSKRFINWNKRCYFCGSRRIPMLKISYVEKKEVMQCRNCGKQTDAPVGIF